MPFVQLKTVMLIAKFSHDDTASSSLCRFHRLHCVSYILPADRHGWKDCYSFGGGEPRSTRPLQQTQVLNRRGLYSYVEKIAGVFS